jgi:hypothetical protein
MNFDVFNTCTKCKKNTPDLVGVVNGWLLCEECSGVTIRREVDGARRAWSEDEVDPMDYPTGYDHLRDISIK